MNKKDLIIVVSQWLRETKQIANIRELGYKIHSEQNFINIFDFVISVLNNIRLRYVIVDLKELSDEDIALLPLPFLKISYLESNHSKVLNIAELARNTDFLEKDKNYYAILLGDEAGKKISHKDRFLGFIERMGSTAGKLILVSLFGLGFFLDIFNLFELFAFVICLIGLAISEDLLNEQNDNANRDSLIQKICSGGSSTASTDCKSLANKSAKLFNYIEWSGLGVMIFGVLIANIFLMGLTANNALLQALMTCISFIAILFSFFSFHEQYKQKIFCRSCTLVMSLFYLLFFVSVYTCKDCALLTWDNNTLFPLICSAVIFIYGFSQLLNNKKMNLLKKKYSYSRMRHLRFAAHPSILNVSSTQKIDEEGYSYIMENGFSINFIDSEMKTLTIFVCAHCSHCSNVIEKIIKEEIPSSIQIKLVYLPVAMNYDSDDIAIKRGARIIEVLEKEGIEAFSALFSYCQKVNGDNDLINAYIDRSFNLQEEFSQLSFEKSAEFRNIALRNNINSFPKFMINNTFASDLYALEELFLHF